MCKIVGCIQMQIVSRRATGALEALGECSSGFDSSWQLRATRPRSRNVQQQSLLKLYSHV